MSMYLLIFILFYFILFYILGISDADIGQKGIVNNYIIYIYIYIYMFNINEFFFFIFKVTSVMTLMKSEQCQSLKDLPVDRYVWCGIIYWLPNKRLSFRNAYICTLSGQISDGFKMFEY